MLYSMPYVMSIVQCPYRMLSIPPTAHVIPLESVPLVPHPALCLVPRQLRDHLSVQEPDLDVHQQPETQTCLLDTFYVFLVVGLVTQSLTQSLTDIVWIVSKALANERARMPSTGPLLTNHSARSLFSL